MGTRGRFFFLPGFPVGMNAYTPATAVRAAVPVASLGVHALDVLGSALVDSRTFYEIGQWRNGYPDVCH